MSKTEHINKQYDIPDKICDDAYNEGYEDGKEDAYNEGYEDGFQDGCTKGLEKSNEFNFLIDSIEKLKLIYDDFRWIDERDPEKKMIYRKFDEIVRSYRKTQKTKSQKRN